MTNKIEQIMTRKLFSVPMGSFISEARLLMTEKRIRHLPVVDELDDVVGLVSDRDLASLPNAQEIPVEWVMSSPVVYTSVNSSIREVALMMLKKKISSVFIIDESEDVKGIVTTDDLLWCLASVLNPENSADQMEKFRIEETIGSIAQSLSSAGI